MAGSRNYGVFDGDGGSQLAYARAITDGATFAWIADVFVAPEARGRGVGKLIMAGIIDDLEPLGLSGQHSSPKMHTASTNSSGSSNSPTRVLDAPMGPRIRTEPQIDRRGSRCERPPDGPPHEWRIVDDAIGRDHPNADRQGREITGPRPLRDPLPI